MCEFLAKGKAVCAFLSASIMAVTSCVNERYEISDDNLDLKVTIFQEGLSLPLGSTGKIRMDSIMNKIGLPEDFKQYLSEGADGSYALSYRADEPLDMTEKLGSLKNPINIKKVDLSQSLSFSLSNANASGFSYDGVEFNAKENLSENFPKVNIPVPQINSKFDLETQINTGITDLGDLDLSEDFGGDAHSTDFVLSTLDSRLNVPGSLLLDKELAAKPLPISEVSSKLGRKIEINTKIEASSVQAQIQHAFPKEVKSVSSLMLNSDAKLKIKVKVLNPFFNGGSVIPHIDLNFSEIFHLADRDGFVHDDHIDSDFVLSQGNNWTAVGEYNVTGVVLDDNKDWKVAPNADGEQVLWLDKEADVKVSGSLTDGGLTTSYAFLDSWLDNHSSDRSVDVLVEVWLENFTVSDAIVELYPVRVETSKSFPIEIPQISLPEQVKSVETVTFAENSKIDLILDARELFKAGDLLVNVESMSVTFPQSLMVEGADDNNTVVLSGEVIPTEKFTRRVNLKGMKLNEPDENGKIAAVSELVRVDVVLSTTGEVSIANVLQAAGQNAKLPGEVLATMDIADYAVKMAEVSVDSHTNPELFKPNEIKIKLPQQMSDSHGMAVSFKNNPAISITVDLPETSSRISPVGKDGLSIQFPDMLKFKTGGPYDFLEWFDPVRNALVFAEGERIPESLSLPIEHLIVNPVKDQTDGEYYTSGSIQIVGGLGLQQGAILTKKDIDKLSQPDSRIQFVATVPALEVDEINLQAYSSTIEKNVEFVPFKSVNLPDLVTYVETVNPDETYLSISMKAGKDFPDLGDKGVLSMSLDVMFPDFIIIDDPRYVDGKLSVLGVMEEQQSGSKEMIVEPVRIRAIEVNKSRENIGDVKGNIKINGSVNISGATIDADDWLGGKAHKLDFVVSMSTMKNGQPSANIQVKSITGKLEYSLEPMEMIVDFTSLSTTLNDNKVSATLDMPSFYIALEMDTNLAVPLDTELSVVPYYGEDTGDPLKKDIFIEGAKSSEDQKKTVLWLSSQAPAAGNTYQFVDVDLMSLMYKEPAKKTLADSMLISLSAKVDKERICLYEPSADYNFTFDYSAGMPFVFGKDFEIVYRDTIADISEDIAQIIAYSGGLGLGGDVENALPFNVTMTAALCDSTGNRVGGTPVKGALIKPSDVPGRPVNSPIDLYITLNEGAQIDNITSLQIELKVDARNGTGVPLRKDSYIKVNSLYALVPQGLTLDLSE